MSNTNFSSKFMLSRTFSVFVLVTSAMFVGCGEKRIPTPQPPAKKHIFQHPAAGYSVELPFNSELKTTKVAGIASSLYRCRIGLDAAFSTWAIDLEGDADLADVAGCEKYLKEQLELTILPVQGKVVAQEFRLLQNKYPLLDSKAVVQVPGAGQAEMQYQLILTNRYLVHLSIMGQPWDLKSSTVDECLRSLKVLEHVQP